MNRFDRWLTADISQEKVIRRGTFWNLIASVINAAMTAVIIFFMSWTGSAEMTGIFSIATAAAYQVQAIGFFGVRNIHMADVKHEYSFSDYVMISVFSSIVMAAALGFMSFGKGYAMDKALVVLFYSLYRAIDIYEALYHDEYQRQGRIDIGLILQTARYILSLIVMIAVLLISGSLVWACLAAFLVSAVLVVIQNWNISKTFHCRIQKPDFRKLKKLFVICLPVCLAAFISMYLVNASKYAIDSVLNDQVQGVFAILFVPVFTINLMATVVYRPYITKISEQWHNGETAGFVKSTAVQLLVILILTGAITCFGWLIGLRLLGLLYNTDLHQYMSEFLILLLGGGLNTLAVFLNQILVICGCYNVNLLIYLAAFAVTWFSSTPLVQSAGILGASLLYSLSSLILVLFSLAVLARQVSRHKQAWKNGPKKKRMTGPSA